MHCFPSCRLLGLEDLTDAWIELVRKLGFRTKLDVEVRRFVIVTDNGTTRRTPLRRTSMKNSLLVLVGFVEALHAFLDGDEARAADAFAGAVSGCERHIKPFCTTIV